jgi:putative Holliday junction resolvase
LKKNTPLTPLKRGSITCITINSLKLKNHSPLARILSIDLGKKRTGLAVTDPLQIIATALDTVDSGELIGYLKKYMANEPVEKIVIGYPLNLDDSPTDATPLVEKFIVKFGNVFPNIPVEKIDERMTSKFASQAISEMGLKKKEREKKELIDTVSAVMMLQEYLANQKP